MSRVLSTRKSRTQLLITIGCVFGFAFVIYGLYGAYLQFTGQLGGLTGFQIGAKAAAVYVGASIIALIIVPAGYKIKDWVISGSDEDEAKTPDDEIATEAQ